MILITGASGQFGKATINSLLKKGINANYIKALARDPAKAEDIKQQGIDIVIGDYNDPSSLRNAMKGVEKLLLVSGNDLPKRLEQHKNVIDAAKESGIKHIVYTSFLRKNDAAGSLLKLLAQSHIETENYLKGSGINYTIMQNTLYADVVPMFVGPNVIQTGIMFPSGEGKVGYATRSDMAEAAAVILTESGHENKSYEISSGINYSMFDIADILSELTGGKVIFHNPPAEVFRDVMVKASVPEEMIGMTMGFGEAIKQGEFETESRMLEQLLGRPPVRMKDFLGMVYRK